VEIKLILYSRIKGIILVIFQLMYFIYLFENAYLYKICSEGKQE